LEREINVDNEEKYRLTSIRAKVYITSLNSLGWNLFCTRYMVLSTWRKGGTPAGQGHQDH
jgi:hypothetical protein